ncbi:vanadium-dependent haloperoxidase [Nocardia crassostreae]|uniref:vanadium-dependent haloperoxidase n=1 Tax=Nocardia crassostreae TaxID=53428 RepID=UPI0008294F4F|nr:vanadium-dependent haloperoxidase [Nocardia crassostreae]
MTSRYTLDSPPKGNDPRYLAALREVRGKGIGAESAAGLPAGFATRTAREMLIGIFWAYDGAKQLGTPPRFYNQIVRELAIARGNGIERNARLFALVNTALADAGILCWDDKYRHNLWRPVLGIREYDQSLGPDPSPGHGLDPDCDPFWQPHGAPRSNEIAFNFTPPFPAYPSGHATFGAADLQMTRRFYGVHADGPDNLADGMGFFSDELNGVTSDNYGVVRPRHGRKFPKGLWQMMEENGRSRVFLGVHWSFDAFATNPSGGMDLSQNIGGVRLGRDIANNLWINGLKQAAGAEPRLP